MNVACNVIFLGSMTPDPHSEIYELILRFKRMTAHISAKVTLLQHTSSYMFLASVAHHQGAHNFTKEMHNVFCK
jgi:hypothetical protein